MERSKQTVQNVSFGSIKNMFQRKLVKMNGQTFSLLVNKLYGKTDTILEESNCELYVLFRSLEKIKTNSYKS